MGALYNLTFSDEKTTTWGDDYPKLNDFTRFITRAHRLEKSIFEDAHENLKKNEDTFASFQTQTLIERLQDRADACHKEYDQLKEKHHTESQRFKTITSQSDPGKSQNTLAEVQEIRAEITAQLPGYIQQQKQLEALQSEYNGLQKLIREIPKNASDSDVSERLMKDPLGRAYIIDLGAVNARLPSEDDISYDYYFHDFSIPKENRHPQAYDYEKVTHEGLRELMDRYTRIQTELLKDAKAAAKRQKPTLFGFFLRKCRSFWNQYIDQIEWREYMLHRKCQGMVDSAYIRLLKDPTLDDHNDGCFRTFIRQYGGYQIVSLNQTQKNSLRQHIKKELLSAKRPWWSYIIPFYNRLIIYLDGKAEAFEEQQRQFEEENKKIIDKSTHKRLPWHARLFLWIVNRLLGDSDNRKNVIQPGYATYLRLLKKELDTDDLNQLVVEEDGDDPLFHGRADATGRLSYAKRLFTYYNGNIHDKESKLVFDQKPPPYRDALKAILGCYRSNHFIFDLKQYIDTNSAQARKHGFQLPAISAIILENGQLTLEQKLAVEKALTDLLTHERHPKKHQISPEKKNFLLGFLGDALEKNQERTHNEKNVVKKLSFQSYGELLRNYHDFLMNSGEYSLLQGLEMRENSLFGVYGRFWDLLFRHAATDHADRHQEAAASGQYDSSVAVALRYIRAIKSIALKRPEAYAGKVLIPNLIGYSDLPCEEMLLEDYIEAMDLLESIVSGRRLTILSDKEQALINRVVPKIRLGMEANRENGVSFLIHQYYVGLYLKRYLQVDTPAKSEDLRIAQRMGMMIREHCSDEGFKFDEHYRERILSASAYFKFLLVDSPNGKEIPLKWNLPVGETNLFLDELFSSEQNRQLVQAQDAAKERGGAGWKFDLKTVGCFGKFLWLADQEAHNTLESLSSDFCVYLRRFEGNNTIYGAVFILAANDDLLLQYFNQRITYLLNHHRQGLIALSKKDMAFLNHPRVKHHKDLQASLNEKLMLHIEDVDVRTHARTETDLINAFANDEVKQCYRIKRLEDYLNKGANEGFHSELMPRSQQLLPCPPEEYAMGRREAIDGKLGLLDYIKSIDESPLGHNGQVFSSDCLDQFEQMVQKHLQERFAVEFQWGNPEDIRQGFMGEMADPQPELNVEHWSWSLDVTVRCLLPLGNATRALVSFNHCVWLLRTREIFLIKAINNKPNRKKLSAYTEAVRQYFSQSFDIQIPDHGDRPLCFPAEGLLPAIFGEMCSEEQVTMIANLLSEHNRLLRRWHSNQPQDQRMVPELDRANRYLYLLLTHNHSEALQAQRDSVLTDQLKHMLYAAHHYKMRQSAISANKAELLEIDTCFLDFVNDLLDQPQLNKASNPGAMGQWTWIATLPENRESLVTDLNEFIEAIRSRESACIWTAQAEKLFEYFAPDAQLIKIRMEGIRHICSDPKQYNELAEYIHNISQSKRPGAQQTHPVRGVEGIHYLAVNHKQQEDVDALIRTLLQEKGWSEQLELLAEAWGSQAVSDQVAACLFDQELKIDRPLVLEEKMVRYQVAHRQKMVVSLFQSTSGLAGILQKLDNCLKQDKHHASAQLLVESISLFLNQGQRSEHISPAQWQDFQKAFNSLRYAFHLKRFQELLNGDPPAEIDSHRFDLSQLQQWNAQSGKIERILRGDPIMSNTLNFDDRQDLMDRERDRLDFVRTDTNVLEYYSCLNGKGSEQAYYRCQSTIHNAHEMADMAFVENLFGPIEQQGSVTANGNELKKTLESFVIACESEHVSPTSFQTQLADAFISHHTLKGVGAEKIRRLWGDYLKRIHYVSREANVAAKDLLAHIVRGDVKAAIDIYKGQETKMEMSQRLVKSDSQSIIPSQKVLSEMEQAVFQLTKASVAKIDAGKTENVRWYASLAAASAAGDDINQSKQLENALNELLKVETSSQDVARNQLKVLIHTHLLDQTQLIHDMYWGEEFGINKENIQKFHNAYSADSVPIAVREVLTLLNLGQSAMTEGERKKIRGNIRSYLFSLVMKKNIKHAVRGSLGKDLMTVCERYRLNMIFKGLSLNEQKDTAPRNLEFNCIETWLRSCLDKAEECQALSPQDKQEIEDRLTAVFGGQYNRRLSKDGKAELTNVLVDRKTHSRSEVFFTKALFICVLNEYIRIQQPEKMNDISLTNMAEVNRYNRLKELRIMLLSQDPEADELQQQAYLLNFSERAGLSLAPQIKLLQKRQGEINRLYGYLTNDFLKNLTQHIAEIPALNHWWQIHVNILQRACKLLPVGLNEERKKALKDLVGWVRKEDHVPLVLNKVLTDFDQLLKQSDVRFDIDDAGLQQDYFVEHPAKPQLDTTERLVHSLGGANQPHWVSGQAETSVTKSASTADVAQPAVGSEDLVGSIPTTTKNLPDLAH